jgi:hypothetical protein
MRDVKGKGVFNKTSAIDFTSTGCYSDKERAAWENTAKLVKGCT